MVAGIRSSIIQCGGCWVIELLDRKISGLSEASRITLERIVETILMALMAWRTNDRPRSSDLYGDGQSGARFALEVERWLM